MCASLKKRCRIGDGRFFVAAVLHIGKLHATEYICLKFYRYGTLLNALIFTLCVSFSLLFQFVLAANTTFAPLSRSRTSGPEPTEAAAAPLQIPPPLAEEEELRNMDIRTETVSL